MIINVSVTAWWLNLNPIQHVLRRFAIRGHLHGVFLLLCLRRCHCLENTNSTSCRIIFSHALCHSSKWHIYKYAVYGVNASSSEQKTMNAIVWQTALEQVYCCICRCVASTVGKLDSIVYLQPPARKINTYFSALFHVFVMTFRV